MPVNNIDQANANGPSDFQLHLVLSDIDTSDTRQRGICIATERHV